MAAPVSGSVLSGGKTRLNAIIWGDHHGDSGRSGDGRERYTVVLAQASTGPHLTLPLYIHESWGDPTPIQGGTPMAERVHHREPCKSSYSLAVPRSILFLSAFRPESAWCQNGRKVAAGSGNRAGERIGPSGGKNRSPIDVSYSYSSLFEQTLCRCDIRLSPALKSLCWAVR